jgi:DNA mismatch repair protein MutS
VPADYRRRQTLKNAERFITPELKAFEDQRAVGAGACAGAREGRCTRQLLDALQPHVGALQRAGARGWPRSTRCAALAERAYALDWMPPRLRARRPASRSTPAATRWWRRMQTVADRFMRQRRAGSTRDRACCSSPAPTWAASRTYMRQVALIVLLARCRQLRAGQRAAGSGPIDRIFTRIGAADDLASGAVHLHGGDDRGRPPSCNGATPSAAWC